MRKWALAVQTRGLWGGTIPPVLATPTTSDQDAAVISRSEPASGGSDARSPASLDADSRRWVERLRAGHPRHDQTVGSLHDVLRRVASYELSRRRQGVWSISGPEFDDLAEQAADDALVNVLAKLDEFRGLSRFTTWAYKFVMFEVSAKVARHAWRRQRPDAVEAAWDQVPDPTGLRPEDWLEQKTQLGALSQAIGELTERQREVFVAVALNELPIDVMAVKLGTNRNAVYKNLFDARRRLRAMLAAAGQPVSDGTVPDIPASSNARLGPPAASSSHDAAMRDRR